MERRLCAAKFDFGKIERGLKKFFLFDDFYSGALRGGCGFPGIPQPPAEPRVRPEKIFLLKKFSKKIFQIVLNFNLSFKCV